MYSLFHQILGVGLAFFQFALALFFNNFFLQSGFPPGMFERGGPKWVGGLGVLPQEKKNQIFKFFSA